MNYTVTRPSDGEKLAVHDSLFDAVDDALNYATVDEESIVVVREPDDVSITQRFIVRVVHPSGAVYVTTGTPGGREPRS